MSKLHVLADPAVMFGASQLSKDVCAQVFVFACVLLAAPGRTTVDAWPFLRDSSM